MSERDFYAKGTCQLCNGKRQIEVTPEGWSPGPDSVLDECPWCLRRELHAANVTIRDLSMLIRRIVRKPVQKHLDGAFNYLVRKGIAGSVMRGGER